MLTIPNAVTLTHAEAKVLALVDDGHSNQMIAATLAITVGTAQSHLHRVYEKLDARNRLDAISKARMRVFFAVTVGTIKGHLIHIYRKLNVRNRAGAWPKRGKWSS
jgi:ATP/maltotriose-dependent transcriptional regulator MalT